MADSRYFAKLDLGYFENPKIADLIEERPRVAILHLRAILYCREHLTDGRFPIRTVVRLAYGSHCGSQCQPQCDEQCDFCAAVDAGLFNRINARSAEVHDYLKHQDSAKKAADRKAAGQAGAAARWGVAKNAKGNADRIADRIATSNAEERRGEEKKSAVADAPVRPEVEDLCSLLADLIESNGSKRPNVTKGWRDSARLMLDTDKRPVSEVKAVMRWSQQSDFWKSNVLSMPTLRAKYDTLRLQAQRDQPQPEPVRNPNIPEGW